MKLGDKNKKETFEVFKCKDCGEMFTEDLASLTDDECCWACAGEEMPPFEDYGVLECVLCGTHFGAGNSGNELGFCINCQAKDDFPYDIDKYYEDYDNNKVVFKDVETMARGILEPYRKEGK